MYPTFFLLEEVLNLNIKKMSRRMGRDTKNHMGEAGQKSFMNTQDIFAHNIAIRT